MTRSTVASPICLYDGDCPNKGRAVLGRVRRYADCENRTVHCLTCGAKGEQSVGIDAVSRKSYRDLKIEKFGTRD